jgi:hypothetical protein
MRWLVGALLVFAACEVRDVSSTTITVKPLGVAPQDDDFVVWTQITNNASYSAYYITDARRVVLEGETLIIQFRETGPLSEQECFMEGTACNHYTPPTYERLASGETLVVSYRFPQYSYTFKAIEMQVGYSDRPFEIETAKTAQEMRAEIAALQLGVLISTWRNKQ